MRVPWGEAFADKYAAGDIEITQAARACPPLMCAKIDEAVGAGRQRPVTRLPQQARPSETVPFDEYEAVRDAYDGIEEIDDLRLPREVSADNSVSSDDYEQLWDAAQDVQDERDRCVLLLEECRSGLEALRALAEVLGDELANLRLEQAELLTLRHADAQEG